MRSTPLAALLTAFLLAGIAPLAGAAAIEVSYLYDLSDFSGTIPYSDVLLHVDRTRDEVYTTTGRTVRVFNSAGMEIFRFGDDWDLGMIYGLAVDETGDIFLLTHEMGSGNGSGWALVRCDYRGEPLGRIEVAGVPAEFAAFSPTRMVFRDGRFYLASPLSLQVLVLDRSGAFHQAYDLADLTGIEDPTVQDMFGFDVDRSGNLLFTIPVLFKVFVVSSDGTVRQFGSPGSAPGLFGIVSGVVADDEGNVIVSDKLRNVVMVFDPSHRFITEFGSAGSKRSLTRPADLALGNRGRLYVTQARDRGVAVYGLTSTVAAFATEDSEQRSTLK